MTPTTFSPRALSALPPQPRVRPARLQDSRALQGLIQHYADQGILLPRTEQEIQTIITDFRVISYRKTLLTCGILEFYTPQVAELRSLAVSPGLRGAGLGRRLAAALVDEARRRGAEMVFALTYSTEFFAKLGFSPVSRQLLPWKVWKDCLRCPKHECCDESAVARWLKPRPDSRPLFPILPSAPLAGRA